MRKLFIALVAISLIGVAPAHAVVKAGSACSKVGSTATVAGKKYTCIKSGTKLIWSKGVVIKKSSPLTAGVCPPKSAADNDPGISQQRANTLLGMSENEAEMCSNLLGWSYRVGERDGESFPGTLDFRVDRVTVISKNGIITQVLVG